MIRLCIGSCAKFVKTEQTPPKYVGVREHNYRLAAIIAARNRLRESSKVTRSLFTRSTATGRRTPRRPCGSGSPACTFAPMAHAEFAESGDVHFLSGELRDDGLETWSDHLGCVYISANSEDR